VSGFVVKPVRRSLSVIYRVGKTDRPMGNLPGDFGNARSLDPFVSSLMQEGQTRGQLLLIEADTGNVLAKRTLKPYVLKPNTRLR
jgi:hypothetical protein